ncbi:hypothetical protein SDC9_109223 [bioreactor metagenome]|uniref:Uncharacterized protein n=1 Tax=bioreactor metagenome TaxID=1076179 RepID=A0A645BAD0_9ZZZZ
MVRRNQRKHMRTPEQREQRNRPEKRNQNAAQPGFKRRQDIDIRGNQRKQRGNQQPGAGRRFQAAPERRKKHAGANRFFCKNFSNASKQRGGRRAYCKNR